MEDVLVEDARVPIEDTPVWPEFLELETPVPVKEALGEIGPLTIELERLVRIPALLCRLFLEAEVRRKEGSGDLEREPEGEVEVEVEVEVALPILLGTASLPFTFVTVGLGISLEIAGAGAFPRFHTL